MTKYPDRPSSGKPLAKTSGKKTASNPPKATPATGTALAANRSTATGVTTATADNPPAATRSIPYAELHALLSRFMQSQPSSDEPAHTASSCAQAGHATTAPGYIQAGHATTSPSPRQSAPSPVRSARPATGLSTGPTASRSARSSASCSAGPTASRSGHSPTPDGGDGLHAFITLLRDWGDHLRFISRLDLVQASPELIATGRAFYNSFARAAEDPLSALDPQEDDIEMQLLVAYCRLQLETGLDFDRLHQLNEPIAQLCGLFFYLGYCYCVYEPHDLREDWRYSLLQDLFATGDADNKKQGNIGAAGKQNGDKSECNKLKAYKAKSGNGAKEQDANR